MSTDDHGRCAWVGEGRVSRWRHASLYGGPPGVVPIPFPRRERDRVGTVVGQWRAMYTPGDWVLLSGPTSLVLLEPPAPERSSMINLLWQGVVASSSMSDLAGRLATFPIEELPSFAAFFWTENGMRSLVRGAVSVVDLASGVTVAQGEGIQTWTEVGLEQVSQVQVEAQSPNGTQLELPLVVGAVRASSVRLDASPAARVSSPQRALDPDAAPAYAMPAEVAPARREPAAAEPAAGAIAAAVPVGGSPIGAELAAGPFAAEHPEPQPTAHLEALGGPDTELLADPFADDPSLPPAPPEPAPIPAPPEPAPIPAPPEPAPIPAWTEPVPEPEPTEPAPARRMASDSELENADTELIAPPYAASAPEQPLPPGPPAALDPTLSDNSLIMAVVCQYGHASPQNATHCRTCGSPIAPQGPQLVPRPVLAVLRASDGTTAAVDRAVLIGRAPSAQRSSARAPRLLTLPSPGHDISRTHVEVVPEGWQVAVTDLHSTNGTVLIDPGGNRQQLTGGEAVQVELGTVVELGDGVSVLIDFPQ